MTQTFTFLPDALAPLAAAAKSPTGTGTRRTLTYVAAVVGDDAAPDMAGGVTLSVEVLGPGDAVGVEPSMICRVEPPADALAVEPNYMPFVEFVDADFPWRYSLKADVANRRIPWLTLIALQPGEFEFVDQGGAPLPRIRVFNAAASMPPADETWASAHVHLAVGGAADPAASPGAILRAQPALAQARMLCPRRLKEGAAHYMFLVPTFEAGRLAGLGRRDVVSPWDAYAWDETSTNIELPVYFRSQFNTSALEDFELLVRRLKAVPVNASSPVGQPMTADASAPGYYGVPWTDFPIQDALIQPGATTGPYAPETVVAAGATATPTQRLADTLAAVIAGEAPTTDGPNAGDPLVAMPAYAWSSQSARTVDPAKAAANHWFHRLNLDLRYRQVAGLGAETVRRNQERFAAACWSQYAQIVSANAEISRLQTSQELAINLLGRRFSRLAADAALSLAEPVQDLVLARAGETVGQALERAGVPRSMASRGLWRVAAKRSYKADIAVTRSGAVVTRRTQVVPVTMGARDIAARDAHARTESLRQRAATPAAAARFTAGPIGPVTHIDSVVLVKSISTFLTGLPARQLASTVYGLTAAERARAQPVYRVPRIDTALVECLSAFASASILRGGADIANNTITVVKENSAFVEAFLAGANHAIIQEMFWRGFPIWRPGTIFHRFWNRAQGENDIDPIHMWNPAGALGTHSPGAIAAQGGGENLALVMRGDVVRKLGKLVLALRHTPTPTSTPVDHFPTFTGKIGADVLYFGFEKTFAEVSGPNRSQYAFVLFEPVGQLRFGLDIADVSTRRRNFPSDGARYPFRIQAINREIVQSNWSGTTGGAAPANSTDLTWDNVVTHPSQYIDFAGSALTTPPWPQGTSAAYARCFMQKPVAALLPSTRVLP